MKRMIFVLLALTMLSCVTTYIPPQNHDFKKSQEFDFSYDDVWSKIITWLGSKETHIKNIDKNSGFISTEYDLATPTYYYMDCGSGGSQTAGRATINIVVTNKDKKVNVTINTFFSCFLSYIGWDKGADQRIDCNSTGILEKELFDFISK